jgi:hypothetical protein
MKLQFAPTADNDPPSPKPATQGKHSGAGRIYGGKDERSGKGGKGAKGVKGGKSVKGVKGKKNGKSGGIV